MLACAAERLDGCYLLCEGWAPGLKIGVSSANVPLQPQTLADAEKVEVSDELVFELIYFRLVNLAPTTLAQEVVVSEEGTCYLEHCVSVCLQGLVALPTCIDTRIARGPHHVLRVHVGVELCAQLMRM